MKIVPSTFTYLLTIVLAFASFNSANSAEAVFAGGCFWCIESDFEKLAGVNSAISGYTGGSRADANYQKVSAGSTGHYEAVKVTYDSKIVSYEKLLDLFWRNIDPFDAAGQFCDKGSSYRSAIFVSNDTERDSAEKSKLEFQARFGPKAVFVTPIVTADTFYPAEDYHQGYYKKNPIRYAYYRNGCGRDQRLQQLWGDK